MISFHCPKFSGHLFPFVNTPYELLVYAIDSATQHVITGVEIPINVHLFAIENGQSEIIDKYLDLTSSDLKISNSGTVTLTYRITKTSFECGNRHFMIQLSGSNILTYSSPLMFVVAHKLVLKEPIPDLWYKDNGRKGKWIPLHLQLVNEHNYLVRSRNVPLQLSLHYSCGSLVPNQTLLKYTPVNPHISDNGEIIIHFRIEEVSRSHQNQLFMIRVSPDIVQFPLNNDINSVETTPIRVMSKERPSQKANSAQTSHLEDERSHEQTTLPKQTITTTPPEQIPPPPPPSQPLVPPSQDHNSSVISSLLPNPPEDWSRLTLNELVEVRDRIDVLLMSYHSIISSQLPDDHPSPAPVASGTTPNSNSVEKPCASETKDCNEDEDSSDYQEDMYPNNSEDFNLLYLNSAASDWGQIQTQTQNYSTNSKRKRT